MNKFLVFVLVLAFPLLANASSARQASLEELLDYSTLIVVGTPASRTSAWEKTRIYTTWDFLIEEVWLQEDTVDPKKLSALASLTKLAIKTLGGIVGEIGQTVAGSPRLITGQTYLLFLTPSQEGSFFIVGLSQGAFEVNGESLRQLSQLGDMKIVDDRLELPSTRTKLRQAIIQARRSKPHQ